MSSSRKSVFVTAVAAALFSGAAVVAQDTPAPAPAGGPTIEEKDAQPPKDDDDGL